MQNHQNSLEIEEQSLWAHSLMLKPTTRLQLGQCDIDTRINMLSTGMKLRFHK